MAVEVAALVVLKVGVILDDELSADRSLSAAMRMRKGRRDERTWKSHPSEPYLPASVTSGSYAIVIK